MSWGLRAGRRLYAAKVSLRPDVIALLALVLFATACTGGSDTDGDATPEPVELGAPPRVYRAEWLIDAEAVGAEGPGFPFRYVEVVDDRTGRYLVQAPNHLATQVPDEVVFCAAIFRNDPYCASTPRPENTPPVFSYPVQLLRSWGPNALYDLAGWREVSLVAETEPGAWNRRRDVVRDIRVECFAVVGETAAAREGFEVCYTDDDLHLVASVDLQGDLVYEIDLIAYDPFVDAEDFETNLEEFVEASASLQDQLITLFPEIPAPRPTPTPDPDGGDDDPEG